MEPVLSDQQLNEFKRILKQRYQQLRKEISEELRRTDEEQYIELAGRVHDPEEEAVADLLVDLNLASIDRHIQELRQIDAALIRIATMEYGICVDCDQPIGIERLKANPTAERCLSCQEQFEKTHMVSGTPSL